MGKILRDPETVKELAKAFRVSTQMVRAALNDASQSDLAKRIRKRALDMGLKEKGKEQVTVLKWRSKKNGNEHFTMERRGIDPDAND